MFLLAEVVNTSEEPTSVPKVEEKEEKLHKSPSPEKSGKESDSEGSTKPDVESDDSDVSYGSWDYEMDPAYTLETMPFYASQPCFCVRGVSYTPPGWVRKYRKRSRVTADHDEETKPSAAKKLKLDEQDD